MTAIIIVNYKTPWHLNLCLNSIFKHTKDFHIFLVNNSQDTESQKVVNKFTQKYPDSVTLIQNEKNLGFVGGVNSAYSEAVKYERVCFVNSDIIVTKNWLDELNMVFDKNPNVVQVAPDVSQYYNEPLPWRIIKWQVTKRFPLTGAKLYKTLLYLNPPKSKSKNKEFQVANNFYDFCTGACNLIRTKPFEELGYFLDPNIVHGYGDDFDLTYYLRQFGDIGVTEKAYVFHFINVSFNKLSEEKKGLKTKLQELNRLYVVNKWEKRITQDMEKLGKERAIELANHQEISAILKYFGLKSTIPGFESYIKSIPAKQIGEKLLNQ